MRRVRFRPVPNGFRRMDLLTNEGRSWYQGVRIAVAASDRAAHAHGVLHALEVGGSAEPLVLAGKQRRSRARSRTDRRRHAAQPRDQRHVEPARQRSGPERMAPQRGVAPPEREPLYDPVRGRPDGRWIDRRLQHRGDASRASPAPATRRAASSSTTRTSRLPRTFAVGADKIEIRADMFNVFNNQNLLAGGYIGAGREPAGSASTRAEPTSSPGGSSSSRRRIGSERSCSTAESAETAEIDCRYGFWRSAAASAVETSR